MPNTKQTPSSVNVSLYGAEIGLVRVWARELLQRIGLVITLVILSGVQTAGAQPLDLTSAERDWLRIR